MEDPLQCYVDQTVCDKKAMTEGITGLIHDSTPFNGVVWRGHGKSTEIRTNVPWFSTSRSETVAKDFMGKLCCLFKINAVNVRAVIVNDYIGEDHQHSREDEVILEGGGKFYKTADFKDVGFTEYEPGKFEAWYATKLPEVKAPEKPERTYDANELFKSLDPSEYEFIDSIEDLRSLGMKDVPAPILEEVLTKLKKGGRRRRKTRKPRKTKRKHRKTRSNGRNAS